MKTPSRHQEDKSEEPVRHVVHGGERDAAVIEKSKDPQSWIKDIGWTWWESIAVTIMVVIAIELVLFVVLEPLIQAGSSAFSGAYSDALPFLEEKSFDEKVSVFLTHVIARIAGLGFIFYFLRARRLSLRSLGLRAFPPQYWVIVPIVVLMALFVGSLAVQFVESFWNTFDAQQEQSLPFQDSSSAELFMGFVSYIILAPIFEEVVFRGIIFPAFSKNITIFGAALLNSFAWAAIHGQWNLTVSFTILGMAFSYLYYSSRSLWTPIYGHMFKNGVAFYLLFINPGALDSIG